jgi:hypothetical protein
VKIILSAFESSREYAYGLAKAGAPHILTSYYAWRVGRAHGVGIPDLDAVAAMQCMQQAKLRMGDSGAFTFRTAQQGVGTATESLSVDFDAYLEGYMKWLKWLFHKELIDYWVELDIGIVTGMGWVRDQRQRMLAGGLGSGLIQVWHSSDNDWQDWIDLLEEARSPGRSRYVAIEGHQPKTARHPYEKFIKAAYDRGVRVHAFKITGHEDLKRYPFWSVDSTSWLSQLRYGGTARMMRSGGISSGDADTPDRRRIFAGKLRRSTTTLERYEYTATVVQGWMEAERQITDLWAARGVDWDAAIARPTL